MINATNSGSGDYTPVEAGTYPARCYSMVHIGTCKENILGQEKWLNKVRITWELPTETKEFKPGDGEKPYSVSKEFTLSMNEKANLRKFLEGWRGKGFTEAEAKKFDITALLGKPCMLSVIHKTSKQGRLYADISSVSAMPKGFECPAQINPSFEFSYDEFDEEKFNTLPDFLKDKMRQSVEYNKVVLPQSVHVGNGNNELEGVDDLPEGW